ncbi:rhodanese-like domain-containing protein [Salana multivorans]
MAVQQVGGTDGAATPVVVGNTIGAAIGGNDENDDEGREGRMSNYEGDVTPLEAWELLENHDDAVLVDVRTPQEWAETGVPDLHPLRRRAVLDMLVPHEGAAAELLDGFASAGLTPGSDRPLLFICRGGVRSQRAAEIATAAGFGPAYNIAGGVEGPGGWHASGLPLREWDGTTRAAAPTIEVDPDQRSQARPDEDEAGA